MLLNSTLRFVFFVVLGSAVAPVFAQTQSDLIGDEVEQSVLRISWMNGDASLQRGDEPGKWQPLSINVPMTIGDRVYTGAGARLELQSPNLRAFLAPDTELTALNLTEDVQQLSIAQGTLSVRLFRVEDGDAYEVDTPNAAVTLEAMGLYRFYVDESGNTTVAVRRGEVRVAAAGGEVIVRTGEEMQIDGVDGPHYEVLALPLADSWDRWVDSRERRVHAVASYDYVSNDIVGIEDLDNNGRWEETSEYGRVWIPATVPVDWAPYRFGGWIWQDPWGWTWISEEPWGWAPFHYGRWVNRASRWCWVPVGPSVRHVAYAPALVAFVGSGGFLGWFPLGPRDPFIPWWGGRAAVNVNVPNVNYVNRDYVTVVNRGVFGSGAPVRASLVRDTATLREIQRSPVLRGPVPVLPTEASLRISTVSSRAVPQPAATILARAVTARLAPPPAPPAFSAKLPAIRENGGAPLTPVVASRLSVDVSRGARAAVPIRPVLTEDRRMTLSPRPTAEGELPPNPAGAPPGRVPAMPERPFIAVPSGTRGGAEPPGRVAPGAVVMPAAPQRVQPPVRSVERAAPPQPERAVQAPQPQPVVPPPQPRPAIEPAPQRVPESVSPPAERRQPFAWAPRRVASAPPDPLVARPAPSRVQPREEKH